MFSRALRITVLVLIVVCIGLVRSGTSSVFVRDVPSRSATHQAPERPAAPPEPPAEPVDRPADEVAETVEVRVIDDDGVPVEGAAVECYRDGAWDAGPVATAATGGDGRASLELPDGPDWLVAKRAGYLSFPRAPGYLRESPSSCVPTARRGVRCDFRS